MGGLIARLAFNRPLRLLLVWLYNRYEQEVGRVLAWLDARGRKKILVTFEAAIAAQRWYLGFLEEDEDRRRIARLPNAYLHKDLAIETPGSAHRHAWNSYIIILRNGYRQLIDGVPHEHKAGDLVLLRHDQFHEITHCEPGTVTLFMRGFRRGNWHFKVATCATLCGRCAEVYGQCVNGIKTTPYELNAADGGEWRKTTWFSTKTPGLERKLRVRRRALAGDRVRARILTRDEILHRACRENQL